MNSTSERSDGFAMAVAVEGGLALAAVVFAWLFHVSLREQIAPFGMPLAAAFARGLLATLPMLLVFWFLVNSKWPLMRQLTEQVEWMVREMFPGGSVPQFAMVAALAGVGEELLFRGVLQTKLGEWTTPLIGLLLASFIFGLAHALSRMYFTFAVAVGAYLGWMALHYNDLVAPMIAHGLYDFLALVYLSRNALTRVRDEQSDTTAPHTDETDLPHDE